MKRDIFSPVYIYDNKWLYRILLFLLLVLVVYVRFRLLSFPLERDEGEYAYMGKLILDGIPPYKEAYQMKLPGVYYMYAFFMILFGKTTEGIHLGYLFLNVTTILSMYYIFRRIYSSLIAFVAATLFGILSLSPNVLGNAAHATHFILLPALWGIHFLILGVDNKSITTLSLSGFLLGISFIMKQQGICFILFALVFLIYSFLRSKVYNIKRIIISLFVFCLSITIMYLSVVFIVWKSGSFERFWLWTVQYASNYVTMISFDSAFFMLSSMLSDITKGFEWFWYLSTVGVLTQYFIFKDERTLIFSNSFLLFSLVGAFQGFYFRHHYFILLLPILGIYFAIGLNVMILGIKKHFGEKRAQLIILSLLTFLLLYSLIFVKQNRDYYFMTSPYLLASTVYGGNLFAESPMIANIIKNNTNGNDKVAILGSEPQILFYADRKSASGYLYTYPLLENHPFNLFMQQEMIREIETEKPSIILMINYYSSWLPPKEYPQQIFNWAKKYTTQYYNKIAVIRQLDNGTSILSQDDVAHAKYTSNFLIIFKRK